MSSWKMPYCALNKFKIKGTGWDRMGFDSAWLANC